ncbi:MAG TPA: hypothetical protein VN372_10290 [Methanospirillum sp.]|nr:hypothetical protein [Methanospirillum sp.]
MRNRITVYYQYGEQMRFFFVTGMLVVLVLSILCAGSAEQIPDAKSQAENVWNGSWSTEYYIVSILQNGSEIEGRYEPKDIKSMDPGRLAGMVSKDGTIFSGIWTESGPLSVSISDDGMSFTGNGGVRIDGGMNESGAYTTNTTRIGTVLDPENIWSGTWKGARTENVWIQEGTTITGSYHPLPGIADEPGLFEGTVSDDGKMATGTWKEFGNFSFTLSRDGTFFNGTYDVALNASAGSDFWNGTKIQ